MLFEISRETLRLYKAFFKKYYPEDSVIVLLLMFRRKWVLNNNQELDEEKVKKKFHSGEMCFNKLIVPMEKIDNLEYYVKKLLCPIYEGFNKKVIIKGSEYIVDELYKKYSYGFSILFSSPRDTLRATKSLIKNMFDVLLSNDTFQIKRKSTYFDKEFVSFVQKTRHTKVNFLLIDVDNIDRNKIMKYFDKTYYFFKNNEFYNNFIYSCQTPSGGLHFIFKLNEITGQLLLKKDNKLKNDLQNLFDGCEIEIKTMSNSLTHFAVGIGQARLLYITFNEKEI